MVDWCEDIMGDTTLHHLMFQALFIKATVNKLLTPSDVYLIDAIFGRSQAVSNRQSQV